MSRQTTLSFGKMSSNDGQAIPQLTVSKQPPVPAKASSSKKNNFAPFFNKPAASTSATSTASDTLQKPSGTPETRPSTLATSAGAFRTALDALKHDPTSTTVPDSAKTLPPAPMMAKRNLPGTFRPQSAKQQLRAGKRSRQDKHEPDQLLSPDQEAILKLALVEGRSFFFTGSAGTGKSFVLREMIKRLRRQHGYSAISVTASTGIAACSIGGCTLHSFAGVGIGKMAAHVAATRISRNSKTLRRWMETSVLIVDEISMVEASFFDLLEHVARIVRKDNRPFGGIQVVLCGDFFQLPPVTASGQEVAFCFEAQCWNTVISQTIELTHVFRQKEDTFVRILNEMRVDQLSNESVQRLQGLSRAVHTEDGIQLTELYPVRTQVDQSNRARLQQLPQDTKTFIAEDYVRNNDPILQKQLINSNLSVDTLDLKIGAQVMLIVNLDQDGGYVNGSVGLVDSFDEEDGCPIVRFPQGTRKVEHHEWKVEEDRTQVTIARRRQIPLILAWALSIHKSQGQTLERVKVDLNRIFEKGQAYVALSRATSLEGLQILNFRREKVMAHPKVLVFNQTLSAAREIAAQRAQHMQQE